MFEKLEEKLTLNHNKSNATESINPSLIKSFNRDQPFQIAGCQISRDLKTWCPFCSLFYNRNSQITYNLNYCFFSKFLWASYLKFILPFSSKSRVPAINVPNCQSLERLIYFKCTGLIKFYTVNCVSPIEATNPGRFMSDWDNFIRLVFRSLAARFVLYQRKL